MIIFNTLYFGNKLICPERRMAAPLKIDSSGQDVIERVIEVSRESVEDTPYTFEDFFDVEGTLKAITDQKHKYVALQFPDSLLWASTRLQNLIQTRSTEILQEEVRVCVLADTSYGSCCVDEIAAQHFLSTLIIHYGHACLSEWSNRLSVYYVFGKKPSYIDQFVDQHLPSIQNSNSEIYLFYDPVYHHDVELMERELEGKENVYLCKIFKTSKISDSSSIKNEECCNSGDSCCNSSNNNMGTCFQSSDGKERDSEEIVDVNDDEQATEIISICSLPVEERRKKDEELENNNECLIFGRKVSKNIENVGENSVIIWVGESSSICLRNLKMRFNGCNFCIWNPKKQTLSKDRVLNRSLMQRYGLIQKAKESNLIGIVVGTLAVSKYLTILEYVKKIIQDANKNYYLYVIGKINPYKLANYPEVDIFVLIACHENSAIDSREFYKPIITPFELQLALVRGKEWTGKYVPDYNDLINELKDEGEVVIDDTPDDEEEEYTYSLWTDKMVKNPKYIPKEKTETESSDITLRNQDTQLVVQSASAQHYLQSTWKGLEQRIGETEVEKAVEGLTGIPKQYKSEPTE